MPHRLVTVVLMLLRGWEVLRLNKVQERPQVAFAQFVRQAVEDAREQHGWTVSDVAAHTGVGRSTVFRWLAGDWQDYPELAKVRGFCAALGLSVAEALRPLGWPNGNPARRRLLIDEPSVEADLQVILARLADPTVAAEEKHHIRELLRYLARRPARQAY